MVDAICEAVPVEDGNGTVAPENQPVIESVAGDRLAEGWVLQRNQTPFKGLVLFFPYNLQTGIEKPGTSWYSL